MIATRRLRLTAWREADRAAFHALFNTPATMHHLGGVAPRAEFDLLFDKRLADQAETGLSYWAVERRDDGALVGSCGVRRARNYPGTPVSGMLEAGWRIGAAWWRRGFAAEAMEGALRWGWRHLLDDAIGAWTTTENTPSLALMRRLGFRRAQMLDFDRPHSGERCLVHLLARAEQQAA